jgi:hypothetical protein
MRPPHLHKFLVLVLQLFHLRAQRCCVFQLALCAIQRRLQFPCLARFRLQQIHFVSQRTEFTTRALTSFSLFSQLCQLVLQLSLLVQQNMMCFVCLSIGRQSVGILGCIL